MQRFDLLGIICWGSSAGDHPLVTMNTPWPCNTSAAWHPTDCSLSYLGMQIPLKFHLFGTGVTRDPSYFPFFSFSWGE